MKKFIITETQAENFYRALDIGNFYINDLCEHLCQEDYDEREKEVDKDEYFINSSKELLSILPMVPTDEEIFRKVEKNYLIDDAKRHCEDDFTELTEDFTEKDYEVLAERFLYKKDCNIADNATWEYIIGQYLQEEK